MYRARLVAFGGDIRPEIYAGGFAHRDDTNTTKNRIRVTPVQPDSDDAFEHFLLPLDSKPFKIPHSCVMCLVLRVFDDTSTCSRLQRLALPVVKLTEQTRRVSRLCRFDDS